MADDLSAPLGLPRTTKSRWRRIPFGLIGLSIIATLLTLAGLWTVFVDDPLGGEPTAVVKLERTRTGVGTHDVAVDRSPAEQAAAARLQAAEAAGPATLTDLEPADADKPGQPAAVKVSDGPINENQSLSTAPLPKISERGHFGVLPKIASDGSRPLDIYAKPMQRRPASTPKVVIVVGGLGLSQTGTQEALRLLPPAVTFAFAPYGSSLDRWMSRARQDGHELLMQLPLEPFDYPDNDPGPHTLLTGLAPDQNAERLQWILSRTTNYVGVVNYMGGKFTASEAALAPLMRELGGRGVMFLDDGSSNRSVSEAAARAAKTPFARADMVIDAVATDAAIEARLTQLENLARTKGVAIGVASALPISLKHLQDWTKALDARGILLVPVSLAANKADGQG